MRLAFVGLGKMGGQMVTKLMQNGHEAVVLDPALAAVNAMVELGAQAATDRQDAIQKLADQPQTVVWLMIPAGAVQAELDAWLEILPNGSIVIDGGNSRFSESMARAEQASAKGVHFVDVGTSGGILGLTNGFSMMVGGEKTAYEVISPLLDVLAAPSGMQHHFGPSGAGHYVKMIHNGIEYGLMQAYAEGYRLLHDGQFQDLDLAALADVWQHGSIIKSGLNELIQQIYATNPALEGVDGYVADSGEGRWTLETAQAQGIAMPALDAALEVRVASQNGQVDHSTKLLAALRNSFGGHAINKQENA